jgi:hypothetical protein
MTSFDIVDFFRFLFVSFSNSRYRNGIDTAYWSCSGGPDSANGARYIRRGQINQLRQIQQLGPDASGGDTARWGQIQLGGGNSSVGDGYSQVGQIQGWPGYNQVEPDKADRAKKTV